MLARNLAGPKLFPRLAPDGTAFLDDAARLENPGCGALAGSLPAPDPQQSDLREKLRSADGAGHSLRGV